MVKEIEHEDPFGELLRTLRNHARLTQQQLADKIGVTRSYLAAVERGERGPLTEEQIRAAARAISTDPEALFKAAGERRGEFSLYAGPTPLHLEVAAELAWRWRNLDEKALRQIKTAIRGRGKR